MKTSKLFRIMTMMLLFVGSIFTFSACSDDDIESDIFGGTWMAENDAWHMYIEFDKNGTFEYWATSKRGSEDLASGTFKIKGNTIICTGAFGSVYFDGDVQVSDFHAEFTYDASTQLLTRSSGTVFAKGYAYDNKDHSRDNVCTRCDGRRVCGACNGGICKYCNGQGREWDKYVGKWYDCRFCDNGNCSECKGTGMCPECKGTGTKK